MLSRTLAKRSRSKLWLIAHLTLEHSDLVIMREKVGLCRRAGNNPTERTAEKRLQKVTHRRWGDARSPTRSSPITWMSYLVATGHADAIGTIAYGEIEL